MFVVRIAGLNVKIKNKYRYLRRHCKNYIINTNKIDFTISATQKEIKKTKENAEEDFSLGYCESACIYQKICEKMIDYNRFFFHSSVVEVNGETFAFSARSGVGKSTQTKLWMEHFKDNCRVINGDKPLYEIKNNKLYAYGVPWCGKENYNINTKVELNNICFLKRSETNKIRRLEKEEILDYIFEQVIFFIPKEKAEKLLTMLDFIIENIPCYLLECNISDEAVTIAHSAMSKGGQHETKKRSSN